MLEYYIKHLRKKWICSIHESNNKYKKLKGMERQVTIQRQLYIFTVKNVICYISRTMSNIANVFDYTFWQALVNFS